MSLITDFMLGEKPDVFGRYVFEIHNHTHFWLEHDHKFIQVLFPIDVGNKFNKHAPIVIEEDLTAFAASEALRDVHLRSLDLILDYYGLQRVGNDVVVKGALCPKDHDWLKIKNHNQLRITRIIRSLYLLGNQTVAKSLQKVCIEEGQRIGTVFEDTFEHWRKATS